MNHSLSHLNGLGKGITTRSAMNPTLMLAFITTPLGIISATTLCICGQYVAAAISAAFAAVPVAIAAYQLVRWTNTDPSRLQDHQHVENMYQLQHAIAVKDGDTVRAFEVSSQLIDNPHAQLEHKAGE